MSEYFSATRCGLFFFAQIPLANSKLQKALQIALSPQRNPVARYLLEHHAPVHEALVVEPKTWRLICPCADHWHVMAGPIDLSENSKARLLKALRQNFDIFVKTEL